MEKPIRIDPQMLRCAAGDAVGTLKLLANEDRLLLLCQLSQGEMCVGQLEEQLGIHQPTLSQQLGVLRSEGVVATRREGKHIFYSVADRVSLEVLAALYRVYCPKEKSRARPAAALKPQSRPRQSPPSPAARTSR